MRKFALILGSAMMLSQTAMAEAPDARGGLDKEQSKYEREMKLQRDRQHRHFHKELKYREKE
ncbi:hypothetical protein [Thiomicrorhabdus xiamenensis]|uniref:Uncharacterized protein n=1 Tax=Thiomicrorhabdus xiamenensis TaxID=2739063 RepID=A0A7D4NQM5_9GAMM|nr:hypothetical protein [Thiomicrorhabdus xiamenensis]QKI89331.1 hypothetical protein HQN79_07015 [Thiomicrorhabdus xiamenensis]